MTGIAEITAVAICTHRWFPDLPQWITALVALAFPGRHQPPFGEIVR